ncbi:regulator of nonsense transcripts 3B-like [Culicoides brevitarsis]|uniref:regulator of nonsense transcripts 3B-like n=1 Tax=Culicoides brevitarsis TaxID=469753 RepID=UPI00307CA9C0
MTTEKEVTPENESTVDKPKDEKSEGKKHKRHRQSDGVPNRVIIRRLPPTMTEEEFLHQIDPVPKFTAFSFCKPDWSLGVMASSRAYITFENPEEIFVFRDKYDGYVFVDGKGNEYPAVVEYAPFQGFPKTRSKKRDAKMNTIEQDSHYIAFMEALAKAETEIKTETKMEYSYQVKEDTEITSTPLLEYLEGKKKEKLAEKKRKQEEKKKKREEEKMMKKVKLAQKIPEAIKEEGATQKKEPQVKIEQRKEKKEEKRDEKKKSNEKKEKSQEKPSTSKIEADDDGIVVRVVPSRLDRNQRKTKDEAKEEARRDKRRERDRKRKEERAEREQNRGNREKNDRDKKSNPPKEKEPVIKVLKRETDPAKSDPKVDSKPPPQPEPKREVKKYSERRKEIRARAETRRNEAEEKAEEQTLSKTSSLDVSAEPFIPGKKVETWIVKEGPPSHIDPFPKKSIEEKIDSHSESSAMECCEKSDQKLSKEEAEQRRRERAERISNLRNKDRPSIAIYQPRRVRIAANFDQSTDNREESDAKVEGERQKSGKGEKKRHERRKSHRSSGDEKSEKPRHKKKSVTTEDESREMSRQNSQEKSENEGSHENSEKKDFVEPIVEAVQQLAIKESENPQEN